MMTRTTTKSTNKVLPRTPLWLGMALLLVGCMFRRTGLADASAGQIGCTPGEITISDEQQSFGSNTWVAECGGERFICSQLSSTKYNEGQVSCHSDRTGGGGPAIETAGDDGPSTVSRAPSTPKSASANTTSTTGATNAPTAAAATPAPAAAPTGAAGFVFGASPAQVKESCEGSGHQFSGSGASSECSGSAADLGFTASVGVGYCKDAACSIEIVHMPDAHWLRFVSELSSELTEKYGEPAKRDSTVPPDCNDANFKACLDEQRAKVKLVWRWKTGERVELSVGKFEAETEAAVRIRYVKGQKARSVNSSAL